MPSTINVNDLTLVHATSSGVSQSFPDVCKTPSPAGPVPIPYPNVAMSSDTDGTASVKGDGSSCMVKGSTLRMSTGDEAGSLLGVVSNEIKGKAQFLAYSMDVKIEGQNACRLTDPMQHNLDPANAMGPAHVQPPAVGLAVPVNEQDQACERADQAAAKKGGPAASNAAWDGSGIIAEHRPRIQEVVDALLLKVIFRSTKPECAKWIRQKYQPKPHSIVAGTTITQEGKVRVGYTAYWLERHRADREESAKLGPAAVAAFDKTEGGLCGTYASASPSGIEGERNAGSFEGIVGSTIEVEIGKPLLANQRRGTHAKNRYRDKYVTGDYDLQDVLTDQNPNCERLLQTGAAFATFQRMVNRKMDWDGIQHGPQAQWVAKTSHGDFSSFSMPYEIQKWLSEKGAPIPQVDIAQGRKAPIIDSALTVVTPKGARSLDNSDEVKDYLICCGCQKPVEPVENRGVL